MDVTNGLISRLVKSKSTERVLAPIASQVSLLMILNEGEGDESGDGSVLSVSACVERVTQAVDGFIHVGQDQVHRSSDSLFDSQMTAACETLELAKSELFVAGQSLGARGQGGRAHAMLANAAKDLLQAVLRVLIVVDDVEVRRCVQALSVVEDKVRKVCSLTHSRRLVPAFKELTEALLYMTMVVSRRHKDLVSSAHREGLLSGLSLMRKGVSSLRMAVQTHLKYPSNPQADAGKQQVLDQTLTTLSDMRTVLESGPPSDLEADEAGHFVHHIDKMLESLGEDHRFDLSADLESWVASIVRHAMGVGHLSQGSYQHLITHACRRILQSKFRLFELQDAIVQNPHLSEIRLDYEGVCEVLLDDFCELEKHVNMALLHLIIDTACFTSQPLERLASAALHPQGEVCGNLGNSELGQDFLSHGDKLCQVAAMASASSMDPKKVRAVRLSTHLLEQLLPEVLPAVGAVARHRGNAAAVRHLKSMVQEWSRQTEALVRALDSMTDPRVFLDVTEQRMRQVVNGVRRTVSEGDAMGAQSGLRRLLAHAQHMRQVATRVVDHHRDVLFRNGLMVFVQQLDAARSGVKGAGRAAVEDPSHARVADTLHRRLALLLAAAAQVRQGLRGDNHLSVLNPARQHVRRRPRPAEIPPPAGGRRSGRTDDSQPDGNPHSTKVQSAATTSTAANTAQPLTEAAPPATTNTTTDTTTDTTTTDTTTTTTAVTRAPVVIPSTATATTKTDSNSGASPVEGRGQKVGKKVRKEPGLKPSDARQRKGETSLLIEQCGDGVVEGAMRGERGEVGRRLGDVLGWTSHLGEVALSLLTHCHTAPRKSQMRQVAGEVDRLAPLLMEAARFVAAGDTTQADALRLLADDWISACGRLVIMVDVAAGDWLLLIESITQAVTDRDTQALKSLLSILDRSQREMSRLLARAEQVEVGQVAGGADLLHFFHHARPELDNLTATLKTTADCLATTEDSNAVTRTQLLQRGREWGVLVTCLVSQLDWMADHLSTAAQATLGIAVGPTSAASGLGPYGGAASKVVPLLQTHTTRLKEVLGALTAGGESLVKKRSEELSHSLSSLLGEVEEIAQTPVDDHTLPQAQLFARLDAGLARSRWTGKALEAEQLVQRHCHRYSLLVTNLLLSPRMTGPPGVGGVPAEVQDVQERLRLVSQRSLQAIQLSPDLQHRATVRRCLDQLTALMPGIAEKVTDHLSGVGGEGARQEVRAAAVQWGARVHCLLSTLRAMSDVRAAPINEIEKLLSGLPHETSAPTPPSLPPASLPTLPPTTSVPLHTSLPTHQAPLPHTRGGASPARRETPGAAAPRAASQREAPGYGGRPAQGQHPPRTPGRWSPAEHALTPSQPGQDDPFCSAVVEEGGSPVMPMSPYRRSALYTSWLASARYLGEEVAEWEDSDNHFVQLVRSMAQHCQHMADFARGGTSLKDCEEVSSAGLALAASGRQLETFARCLLAMCPPHRSQEDLQKAADRIATYCNQLHIVSTVLINAPAHPQGDCILARNAANLVDAVRHMFSIAEGIAVAGPLTAREGQETDRQVMELLVHWQRKLALYRTQQANIPHTDDLGLRRMELHNPPSLTSLLDG